MQRRALPHHRRAPGRHPLPLHALPKKSGAAFVTWAVFPKAAFAFTEGAPAAYWATDKAERTLL